MTTANNQPERLDALQRLELESTIGFEGTKDIRVRCSSECKI